MSWPDKKDRTPEQEARFARLLGVAKRSPRIYDHPLTQTGARIARLLAAEAEPETVWILAGGRIVEVRIDQFADGDAPPVPKGRVRRSYHGRDLG
jgi:hypothetical protein